METAHAYMNESDEIVVFYSHTSPKEGVVVEDDFFFETANLLRQKYKVKERIRNGKFCTNSNRYRRDNIRTHGGDAPENNRAIDTRTHRREEPHKIARRDGSLKLLPVYDWEAERAQFEEKLANAYWELPTEDEYWNTSARAEAEVLQEMIEKSNDTSFIFRTTAIIPWRTFQDPYLEDSREDAEFYRLMDQIVVWP